MARFAAWQGHRINEVAGEILARCDHALLDDDPASAGDALDRVRALAQGLGDLGRLLITLSPDESATGPTDALPLAHEAAALLGALGPSGSVALPVRADVGVGPVLVEAGRGPMLRALLAAVLPGIGGGDALEVVLTAADGVAVLSVRGADGALGTVSARIVGAPAPVRPEPPRVAGAPWRRALVAEDNEALRDLERMALSALFEEVLVAADGDEALARLSDVEGEVDVVILDLRMPNRNGLEVLADALRRWPTLRVIVASGAAPEGVAQAAVVAGARAVINKPFRLSELRALVRGVLADAQW